jgi:hypothetical protein
MPDLINLLDSLAEWPPLEGGSVLRHRMLSAGRSFSSAPRGVDSPSYSGALSLTSLRDGITWAY